MDTSRLRRHQSLRYGHMGREYVESAVRVAELWLEIPLDEEWLAAYRLVVQDNRFTIAELRVFPNESAKQWRTAADASPDVPRTRPAGVWSAAVLGMDASVPPGGLRFRMLRRLRSRDAAQRIEAILSRHPAAREELLPDVDAERARAAAERRADRRVELAVLAWRYVNLTADGEQAPNRVLAEEFELTREQVRDRIHEARRDPPLLTAGPGPGRAGGSLTDEARQLIESLEAGGEA